MVCQTCVLLAKHMKDLQAVGNKKGAEKVSTPASAKFIYNLHYVTAGKHYNMKNCPDLIALFLTLLWPYPRKVA